MPGSPHTSDSQRSVPVRSWLHLPAARPPRVDSAGPRASAPPLYFIAARLGPAARTARRAAASHRLPSHSLARVVAPASADPRTQIAEARRRRGEGERGEGGSSRGGGGGRRSPPSR
ncbi:hypothetical protein PVAP13_5KG437107 [Panicum virgatum]|uniref:Uncharacterized protein n=1 Tax=Panicum virgatum TaxID=38727 RepID=A0A8T0SS90_PANVG|nr:hypothetical protein PVAP13_5KG437107 [Panicum virgatum]